MDFQVGYIGCTGAYVLCSNVIYVFVFKSGHSAQIACSLQGDVVSNPRTAATQTLDSGLYLGQRLSSTPLAFKKQFYPKYSGDIEP